jgi:hypothetical protein
MRGKTHDGLLVAGGIVAGMTLFLAERQLGPVDPLGWENVTLFAMVACSLLWIALMRLPKYH